MSDGEALEEAEKGRTVTVYPSYPSSSFAGSGASLLPLTLRKANLSKRDSRVMPCKPETSVGLALLIAFYPTPPSKETRRRQRRFILGSPQESQFEL